MLEYSNKMIFGEDEDREYIEEVEYISRLANPRKEEVKIKEDEEVKGSHKRLFDDINSIKEKRNKIITLHLHIERAMDRIIKLMNLNGNRKLKFYKKLELLKSKEFIGNELFHNIKILNQLRNDYAHTLETEEIEDKYIKSLEELKISWDIDANVHHDKFQLIIHQTLFELIDIYDKERAKKGAGKIEKGLTDEDVKNKLKKEGNLFWQYCKVLKCEKEGYNEIYHLQCPYCNKGEIIREYDRTPGFKESYFIACNECGLSGDGSTLKLGTIKIKKDN